MSDLGQTVTKAARRRVLGVPVLYIAAAVAVILAVYAYKTQTRPGKVASANGETDASEVSDAPGDLGSVYPTMPRGTVIVAPASMVNDASATSLETNTEWLRQGVALLGADGVSGGTAQLALQKYLDGEQLSYVQGSYRDKVIAKLGLPPDPSTVGGTDPESAAFPTPIPSVPGTLPEGENTTLSDMIRAAYYAQLGRPASDAEVQTWVTAGLREENVEAMIGGSPEAVDRRNRAAIAGYYRQYLGREAGASEVDLWAPIATSRGLAYVEAGIRDSPEARSR